MPSDTVEFSGRIPRDTYKAFIRAIPIHGANTWFVNRAVAIFLEQLTVTPGLESTLQHTIHRLISETLHDTAQRHTSTLDDAKQRIDDLLSRDRASD